ncbi:MAG: hypothetical protein NVSMB18_32880 [Acetobacteraceae bacterium]
MPNGSRIANIDLDLLRTFLHIAETGSFTRAADLVGRTQSAISMQVQRLESLLGQQLLYRSKGGTVSLTARGSFLIERAKQIIALNDATWAEFHGGEGAALQHEVPDAYSIPIRAQREAFTNQVMITLLTNEQFTRAYAFIMHNVEANTKIEAATISVEDDRGVMALLSMLEYIAINFLSNTMDRAIILRQRRSGLLRVHESLASYIEYKRSVWNRPNVYRSFETVVNDYIKAGPKPAEPDRAARLVAPA